MRAEVRSRWALLSYSLLAFPLAFAGLPLYIHAPDYYVSRLGLPLTSLGLVLLAIRLIDAFQDPLIGRLSDRFRNWKPMILIGGSVMLAAGFWMLFHPPATRILPWFALSLFVCTTGYSIVTINFYALGGLWQGDAKERIVVTTWREAFAVIGLLAAAAVPGIMQRYYDAATVFHYLSQVFLLFLLIALLVFYLWYKQAVIMKIGEQSGMSPLVNGSEVKPWSKVFFSLYFLSSLASSIPAVLVMLYIRDRLNAEELSGFYLSLYFLSAIVAMPLWQKVASRYGKVRSWSASMLTAAVVFVWAFFLQTGDNLAFVFICILSGASFGADLAIPPAIIADHIAGSRRQENATRLFSYLTFLGKASFALATALTLPLLGWMGYQPGNITDYGVTIYLSFAYAFVPSVLKVACFIVVRKWGAVLEEGDENENIDNRSNFVGGHSDN